MLLALVWLSDSAWGCEAQAPHSSNVVLEIGDYILLKPRQGDATWCQRPIGRYCKS